MSDQTEPMAAVDATAPALQHDVGAKKRRIDTFFKTVTAVNGSESLQAIAKKIGIPLNDALLIVFRFAALEIIDYWSQSVLSLPPGQERAAGAAA